MNVPYRVFIVLVVASRFAFAAGENCSTPINAVWGGEYTATGTTCGMGNDYYDNTCLQQADPNYDHGEDVIYHFEEFDPGGYVISVTSNTPGAMVGWAMGACPPGNPCWDYAALGLDSAARYVEFYNLGVSFYLMIDNCAGCGDPPAPSCFDYTLHIYYIGPTWRQGQTSWYPAVLEEPLPTGLSVNTCMSEWHDDHDWPCPNTSNSPDYVWMYTPTEDVRLTFDACGSTYDTKIYLFEGFPIRYGSYGPAIACSDNATDHCGETSSQSYLGCVLLLAGHHYYLVGDGSNGECGTCNITISECPMVTGDGCNNAIPITADLPQTVTGTTCGFYNDYDESCGNPGSSPDVVYLFTPPSDMDVTLSLCESSYNTKLSIRENCETVLACSDDADEFCANGTRSAIQCITLIAGHSYQIIVDGTDGECGDYVLSVSACLPERPCQACTPANADLGDIPLSECGGSVSGDCGWGGKWVASFIGIENAVYHWDLCPTEPCAGEASFNGGDPDIVILDADCHVLAGDDGPDWCNFQPNDWQWTCPGSGTYYIAVLPWSSVENDTLNCHGDVQQTFTLAYYRTEAGPPNGETCATALPITGSLPLIVSGSTTGMGDDHDFQCWDASASPEIVYRYTPTENMDVTFDLCNSSYNTKLYVYDSSCEGVPLECNDDHEACSDGSRSRIECLPLLTGVTYFIVIDGSFDEAGDYSLLMQICYPERPCQACTPVNADLGDIAVNACGDSIFGDCGWSGKWIARFDGLQNAVYHWDLCPSDPCGGHSSFEGGDPDVVILDAECHIVEGIDGEDWCGYNPNDWNWTCPGSGTYYVAVLPWSSIENDTLNCHGTPGQTFTLVYYRSELPGENCGDAPVVSSIPVTLSGNTCGFTNDYDVQCLQTTDINGRDVVYRYQPAADEVITLNLCESSFDSKLYVFADSCTGSPWACNDRDNGVCPDASRPFLGCIELFGGHTYFIVVDAVNEWECGDYELTITPCSPLPGDVIATAWEISSLPFSVTGTTAGYFDQYMEVCPDQSAAPDVVYRYTPTEDVEVEVDLCNSCLDLRIYVYENSRANLLTCDDSNCWYSSRPYISNLYMTAGNTYYFVVDGDYDARGDYQMDVLPRMTGRCCKRNGDCWDGMSKRECAYHGDHGDWTEGLNCADPCPTPSTPPVPIHTVALPVISGCNYGWNVAANCSGEIFYQHLCSDTLYKTNAAGDHLAAVGITRNGEATWYQLGNWDAERQMLWAAVAPDVGVIDPATGIFTTKFMNYHPGDQIVYDPFDGTVWCTQYACNYVAHFDTTGALLGMLYPQDQGGNYDGIVNGVCAAPGDRLYLSHPDARITIVNKLTGAYEGLFTSRVDSTGGGLACDAVTFAPQPVLWWRFEHSLMAYAVEVGLCSCGCPPADSVTTAMNVAHTNMIVYFVAPMAGSYAIFSTTDRTSSYPINFVSLATVDAVAGMNSWTDPSAIADYRRYTVVHICD